MATTIRSGISDLVNILNKLRNNTTVASEQIELQKLINLFFVLWQQVIVDQLDSNTQAYKSAIDSLNVAEQCAKTALSDVEGITKAIESATKAARTVDSIVKFAVKLLG